MRDRCMYVKKMCWCLSESVDEWASGQTKALNRTRWTGRLSISSEVTIDKWR